MSMVQRFVRAAGMHCFRSCDADCFGPYAGNPTGAVGG